MTSAENSGLGASKYENPLGEDTDPPYKVRAFGTCGNAPRNKKPSYFP